MFSSNSSQVSSLAANFIEEVFSTYLYTGTGAALTITNNIDLSTKGGLVWLKRRDGVGSNWLQNTVAGIGNELSSNSTAATAAQGFVTSVSTTGFTVDTALSASANTYASWTFREQPKFFDIQTWTGTGSNTTIAHNLGSVPGCIIVKRTDTTGAWQVYHRSLANTEYIVLNTDAAKATGATRWNSTTPTSSVFSLGTDVTVNASGGTYVAYVYAHDAGGFGLLGTDNVISCGSFTTDGSGNATVSLGYEPQWVLEKAATGAADNWNILDVMRGASLTSTAFLRPNTSSAEAVGGYEYNTPTATGFNIQNHTASTTYIYIAIRRGPMKTPTTGTSVFTPLARTGSGTNPTVVTTGNNPDLLMSFPRTANPAAYGTVFFDKLRGVSQILQSANTNAEATTSGTFCLQGFLNTGFRTGADFVEGYLNYSGATYAQYAMTRAPSFFDEICFDEATAPVSALPHNLTVVPELVIYKKRGGTSNWITFSNTDFNKYLRLNTTAALTAGVGWSATSSTVNLSAVTGSATAVAYLFATCPGVSKVGSYTGNGTTQTIDCGFTGGARFVLIKRTDSTGDWMVSDSARGIIAGNDPYLELNNTNAEVTGEDWLDTNSTGFVVNEVSGSNANTSSATYIFLAIA